MSDVPKWLEERAERIAEELTGELGLHLEWGSTSLPVNKRISGADDWVLCLHPDVDRSWGLDPTDLDSNRIMYAVKCRDPRCGASGFSPYGPPPVPSSRVIKK